MTAAVIPAGLVHCYSTDLHPLGPIQPLGNAGGISGSRLWRFEAPAGPLLVRRWPAGTTADRLATVHRWVVRLASTIPVVAVPLADRLGRSVVTWDGQLWELTRFLPGEADLARPPEPGHQATMFATLARVHDALGDESTVAPSPGLVARRDELRQLIAWEFAHFRRVVGCQPDSDAKWYAAEWINSAELLTGQVAERVAGIASRVLPLQPVLRDVRPDHFLVDDGRLTGLVDFGAMGIESVASDLARLLGESVFRERGGRQAALAAYQSVRLLSAEDQELIQTFEAANAVLGSARWVRWHFIEGRHFDDPRAAETGLKRGYERFVNWVERHRFA